MSVDLSLYTPTAGTIRQVANVFKFPGGEVHLNDLKLGEVSDDAIFIALVRGSSLDDLMAAALWSDVAADNACRFALMLPYLPAARADRGSPEGAYVYSKFINSMLNPSCDQIITVDAHSWVMPKYFGEAIDDLSAVPLIKRALTSTCEQYDAVIAPDAGAEHRAKMAATALGLDFYQCEKHRDFDTGKLLKYRAPEMPKAGRYLVVDDICDGGGTFMLLANSLNLPREQLGLWVTHGIFSGAANDLRARYDRIYTTDSHPGHSRVGCATTTIPTYVYMFQAMKKD
ncbi:ribose-phosphate pyrophosphokinase [Mycolicibacterium sp. BK634]|uniref:ribose-phosphate pyrophosphokinase n=1 Tax=Mycolicibacterium sp. BK634 TaxID=2587099 RepID=UPI001622574E|nr:ribose-phosphate pyrophosphokinase [Mycolicibacterium sp. BK634]MBB3752485.1 ribose-phosphate pyrophosphokinase [Mycolicibacterium sp. BK634]